MLFTISNVISNIILIPKEKYLCIFLSAIIFKTEKQTSGNAFVDNAEASQADIA